MGHKSANTKHIGARSLWSAITICCLAVSAAGCASHGSAKAEVSSATNQQGVTAAKAQLAKYTGVPSFTAPGPAIDVASLKGKSIYNISQSASNPFLAVTEASEKRIAKTLGIKFVNYTTQGSTAEWIRGINEAVANHADAIVLDALDPRLVAPQVQAAKKADIPVLSAQFYDLTQEESLLTGLAGTRSDNFTLAAKLDADYAIADTHGKANVVVVENDEQMSTRAMVASIKKEFAANCPGCKAKFINVPSSDWATKIQSEVQSALVADPSINYVIPIYDPMAQFVIPAIKVTGNQDKVHIATFNGTPAALKMLQDRQSIRMDVGENLDWLAYANLDETFRAMLRKPQVKNENTALRVFTATNVAETGNPPAFNKGFGNSYIAGYQKLWGAN